jgi:crotonobetainyl-CoA:carnitine CoA-transferase CaiB-like acyl-CoA transferase
MPGALSHIRVLDLSRVLAGPWAGRCWPTWAPT